ncbi:hypothetical protein SK128_009539 [Halocaridina rubra]|uniref:Uncharacterized protein n=1 Tax=Halocaridina rubra TaxID=373956 RepID=A0AAN8ZZZ9_HALRR
MTTNAITFTLSSYQVAAAVGLAVASKVAAAFLIGRKSAEDQVIGTDGTDGKQITREMSWTTCWKKSSFRINQDVE